jgi:BirA family biotin operon repressor/biotin-[acetyl-CoA-carboxylase] ligase
MALWPELSLVAGDAVASALREQAGVAAELSHPNDVLIEGRKVAGILPEATVGRVVLGIGVNVNQATEELPAETPKAATALRIETGREWPRAPLLAAILLELERRYDGWQRLHTNR